MTKLSASVDICPLIPIIRKGAVCTKNREDSKSLLQDCGTHSPGPQPGL